MASSSVCGLVGIRSDKWPRTGIAVPGRRAPSGVLAEPHVANEIDIAARQQVLIVEEVEHVGANLDVIVRWDLPRQRQVGIVDELAARVVFPPGLLGWQPRELQAAFRPTL